MLWLTAKFTSQLRQQGLSLIMYVIMFFFLFHTDMLFHFCHFHFGLLCYKLLQIFKEKKGNSFFPVCWAEEYSEFQSEIVLKYYQTEI